MIGDAWIIAGDAYRDATRRKGVVYTLLALAVVQVAAFSLYEEISLGISGKMVTDASLAMVYIVGIISALSIAFQIPRELRERTAMTLFAKPMGRESYLVGKLLGISLLSLINMILVAVGILIIMKLTNEEMVSQDFVAGFAQSAVLSFGAAVVIVSVALLLSLFLSEGAVVIGMVVVLLLGNQLFSMSHSEGGMAGMAGAMKFILPNLFLLDIKTEVGAGLKTSMPYVLTSLGYGISYAVMLTGASVLIFRKRDL